MKTQPDKKYGPAYWELFHHQSDIGIRGAGPDAETAFEQAGIALTAVITDPEKVRAETDLGIVCEAPDLELLLVDWLNALVYEMAIRSSLFSRFEVRLDGTRLQAKVWGEAVDRARHQPVVEVKAATYEELSVKADADGKWVAQCVVDV